MNGTSTGLTVVEEHGRSLHVVAGDVTLFQYVYGPADAPLESPRPYFHPLRTRAGHLVSLFRPWDHVWHKGIAWSLPHVGKHNFWGGPTYVRDRGYVQLDNNGSTIHQAFDEIAIKDRELRIEESLEWITGAGAAWFTERRTLSARLGDAADRWTLGFATDFTNVSGETVVIGSPTTEGRPNAGYGGLFWRGPRSFSSGRVYMAERTGGDELMGERGRWLAFAGTHDEVDASSTLVFVDESVADEDVRWFVRSGEFACVCPAPFFETARQVEPGESLSFGYRITIVDGDTGPGGAAAIASRGKP